MAELDIDLVEWNYGQYEGRWPAEIRADRPEWNLFRHGGPSGEKPRQVIARADRVIARVQTIPGDVLLFTCGQFIRALAARWLGVELILKSPYLMLNTSSLSALGYDLDRGRPVIRLWNDTSHLNRDAKVTAHAASQQWPSGSSDQSTHRVDEETDRYEFEGHHLDQRKVNQVEWCEPLK